MLNIYVPPPYPVYPQTVVPVLPYWVEQLLILYLYSYLFIIFYKLLVFTIYNSATKRALELRFVAFGHNIPPKYAQHKTYSELLLVYIVFLHYRPNILPSLIALEKLPHFSPSNQR